MCVALFALVVYTVIPALAPHFVSKAPVHLRTEGDVAQGLVAAADADPFPAPSRTADVTASPFLTASPLLTPTGRPTERPRSEQPPTAPTESTIHVRIAMVVDHASAKTGDIVQYEVLARNTGDRAFHGALTTNLHTPSGTFRCETQVVVEACTTPGDYDGSSRDPNAAHTNPPGTTQIVTIEPGQILTLYTLRVQIATATAGTVLHNHTHVDGLGSVTALAPDVTATSASILDGVARAPDVAVVP
jgi:hypothetical protein